jgi:hypothetical protein
MKIDEVSGKVNSKLIKQKVTALIFACMMSTALRAYNSSHMEKVLIFMMRRPNYLPRRHYHLKNELYVDTSSKLTNLKERRFIDIYNRYT